MHSKANKTKKRAKKSIELQISKWMEGDDKGLVHKSLSSWHDFVSGQVAARKEKVEVEKTEALWRSRMDVMRKNCDDELDALKSEAQCEKERVHKTVDSVIKKWVLGDDKGLMLA